MYAILTISPVLILLLAIALIREVRFHRALQALMRRLFTKWRRNEIERR